MALAPSDVSVQLQAVAAKISAQRTTASTIINQAKSVSSALAQISTDYSPLIAAISAYGTTDAFEASAKATLAKFTTDFSALKAVTDAIGAQAV